MMSVLDDRVIGLPAVAAVIGMSVVTTRKMVNDPACDLPVQRVGGRWWASRRQLEAWLNAKLGRDGSFPATPRRG